MLFAETLIRFKNRPLQGASGGRRGIQTLREKEPPGYGACASHNWLPFLPAGSSESLLVRIHFPTLLVWMGRVEAQVCTGHACPRFPTRGRAEESDRLSLSFPPEPWKLEGK